MDLEGKDRSAWITVTFRPGERPPAPPTPERLPDWLSDAVDAVIVDLQEPVPLSLSVGYLPDESWEDCAVVHIQEPGTVLGSFGFGVPTHGTEADLRIAIAEGIQEHLPELPQAWAQARPRCPGHPHPATPAEVDGEAWWTCPRDSRAIARIGSYPTRG